MSGILGHEVRQRRRVGRLLGSRARRTWRLGGRGLRHGRARGRRARLAGGLLRRPLGRERAGWRRLVRGVFLPGSRLRRGSVVGGRGRRRGPVAAKEGPEDGALLPLVDQRLLAVRVLDGRDDALAGVAAQVALDQGVQAGNRIEHGAPGSGALLVRVESGSVALLGAAALGRAQVQARLVVLGADAALWLAVVAGLVVHMAEVAAARRQQVSRRPKSGGLPAASCDAWVDCTLTHASPSSSSGGWRAPRWPQLSRGRWRAATSTTAGAIIHRQSLAFAWAAPSSTGTGEPRVRGVTALPTGRCHSEGTEG